MRNLLAAAVLLVVLTVLSVGVATAAGTTVADVARDPVTTVAHVCDGWGLGNDWGGHHHGDDWDAHHHDGDGYGPHHGEYDPGDGHHGTGYGPMGGSHGSGPHM